jgi:predicted TIM-barrel fold metal-dependent hydrolase
MVKPTDTIDEWAIYNCHIHTFTSKHSPGQFWWWVISDASRGKVNWIMIPVYALAVYLYIRLLNFLTQTSNSLAIGANQEAQIVYPLMLLGLLILSIPLFLLVVLIIMLVVSLFLQALISLLIRMRSRRLSRETNQQLTDLKNQVARGRSRVIQSNWLYNVLVWINPFRNDIFERLARFLKIAEQPTQLDVFEQVKLQYPERRTVFVILPMDMGFMDMGKLRIPIEKQHEELLEMAQSSGGKIIPFYAADPRHPDIVQRVSDNLAPDKFRGIKIYPNLGYRPDHPNLMEIYKLCMKGGFPVVTHCSPGGIWRYGLSRDERRENSRPENYRDILDKDEYRELKLCLAHFGGAEEWTRHLKGRVAEEGEEVPWVRTIYNMIASGKYPNLYADISYTVFTPKVSGLEVDLIDYLKVLLTHPRVRERVLFGSDYYMVEQESVSEKEASLLLRSRLGEDLYKQIAHTNPIEYLRLNVPPPKKTVRKKAATRRKAVVRGQ